MHAYTSLENKLLYKALTNPDLKWTNRIAESVIWLDGKMKDTMKINFKKIEKNENA